MLPQSAAVAFVLAEVAVNGAVMERDPVVFAQVGAYLFGTEFAADKGVDVLNELRIELIGFSLTLFGQPALPLGFIGAVLLPLDAVPLDFAADGAFVAVKLFGDFGDGTVAGQVLDMVSFVLGQLCVAHGNLSCRKGRMLPHTGLFLLWKVALQMRIRRRLKTDIQGFQTTFKLDRNDAIKDNPAIHLQPHRRHTRHQADLLGGDVYITARIPPVARHPRYK